MEAVYLAFFRLDSREEIETGALGKIEFSPGIYIYTGSAMKSVEKRLERHFSQQENKHWHIDYFSRKAEPLDYFILPESSEFECFLASILSELGEGIEGFGCSDCDCSSHLFRFDSSTSRVLNDRERD